MGEQRQSMQARLSANPVVVQPGFMGGKMPDVSLVQRWVIEALAHVPEEIPAGEIVVRASTVAEMIQLNASYRGKYTPTNVLSFPAELPPGPWEPVLGDIVICPEVVEQEAEDQGKSLEAHWAHLVVHGVLHLLGYDHLETSEAEIMEDLERRILGVLGYGDPYEGEWSDD